LSSVYAGLSNSVAIKPAISYLCTCQTIMIKIIPMKRILSLLIIFITLGLNPLQAKNLWAFLSYAAFDSPEGPYVDTYLTIAGSTVKFVLQPDGRYQAKVNVLMTFKQGSDIKAFKKYELKSPEIDDTTKTNFHFLDQQRFPLPNGDYDFEIQLSDANKDVKASPYTQQVVVDFPSDKPVFSDIELVKSYKKSEKDNILSKSGFDLVPYVYSFYPESEAMLAFYCELYNTGKVMQPDQKFLITYYVETMETGFKLNDFGKVKRESPKNTDVLLAEIDVKNLATGNYNLVVEARNAQNEVIASKKIFFQRSNPNLALSMAEIANVNVTGTFVDKMTNIDTLREYIRSTRPISTGLEVSFIQGSLKTADLAMLQQFFLNFWQQRKPTDPEGAWKAYKLEVRRVQASFGTPVKKGYETDRGRVYLEYGPPTVRTCVDTDPRKYPYEIWQFNSTIGNQTNRKFVFWAHDVATYDYFLLHSDARGEIYNSRWEVDLTSRTYQTVDISETQVVNAWGDQAREYYDDPY
jgi:GWxTD domain-containing protein